LAEWTGGHLFTNTEADLSTAMERLDQIAPCRATLYFIPLPSERRRDMRIEIDVADSRFRVEAAKVYRSTRVQAHGKATGLSFFRNYHNGLRIAADLLLDVPVQRKWRAAVKVDVSALGPAVLEGAGQVELVVQVINMNGKRIQQSDSWRVDMRRLGQRTSSMGSAAYVFRPVLVNPGPVRIWVGASVGTAVGEDEWLAISQREVDVPGTHEPSWRVAGAPFDDPSNPIPRELTSRSETARPVVAGFACVAGSEYAGAFVQQSSRMPIQLERVRCADRARIRADCACFTGRPASPLTPGVWTLELPVGLAPRTSPLEVQVAPSERSSSHDIGFATAGDWKRTQ
jgi:hypothetical protein